MLSLSFTFAESCAIINPILAPISTGFNVLEYKSNNEWVQTACKIVQSIPAIIITQESILTGLTRSRSLNRIAYKMVCDVITPVFLSLPIINTLLKKVSEHKKWHHIHSLVNEFDRTYMLAIKTFNIAIITLGLIEAMIEFLSFGPLYIPVISLLLLINIHTTIRSIGKVTTPNKKLEEIPLQTGRITFDYNREFYSHLNNPVIPSVEMLPGEVSTQS